MIIFLKENLWFGELSFFANCERKESVRSVKYSTFITIERKAFLRIISEIEKDYVKLNSKLFIFFH